MKHFFHTRLFKICCGIIVVIIIFSIYNCVVSDDRPQILTPEQEEQAEQDRAAYKDTFDVVGDYLFPAQEHSRDELMTDDEREGKTAKAEDKQPAPTAAADTPEEGDIIESADISSDTKPAPPAPAPKEPAAEQLDAPKVTPVE